MYVTCLATHPLVPAYAVGDRTGASLLGHTLSLTLTTEMKRRMAQAIRDYSLRLELTPDELDLIEQDVLARCQAIDDRIALTLQALESRREYRATA